MKEVIIKYNGSKTLALLKTLARFFDFSVSAPKREKTDKERYSYVNGVPVIPGDRKVSVQELHTIFTGKNLNAGKLRSEEWHR